MEIFYIILASLMLPWLLWIERWTVFRFLGKKRRRHSKNIARSRDILRKLKTFELHRMLAYLRKVDPYVFEEVLLTALKAQGYGIKRNRSYSGDGGLDGKIYRNGHCYIVQAKRYTGTINTNHVYAFAALVDKQGAAGGLFIHTGKTPKSAKKTLHACKSVTIVSGQKLVNLMQGKPFLI